MKKYSDLEHKISYNIDASHMDYKNNDISIFIPESKEDIKKIVNNAILKKKNIILRGSGTNLVGSCLPCKNSYIIDLSKINNIYKIENNSITVDPGVVIDDLNIFLQKYKLFFPVIPGSHAAAQIGSMIATNAAGMRAIKYGKMEDWINWIEILIVNKNKKIEEKIISDKELIKILNSEGILGIITKINLKLATKPKKISLDFIKFDKIEDLINKVIELDLNKQKLCISAIEFIDKKVANFLNLENYYYLLVEYENNKGEIQDNKGVNRIWSLRDSCYSIVVSNGYDLIEDPQINLPNIKHIVLWLEENSIPTFGHIGTGILHPHYKQDQKELIKEMYNLVKKLKGKVSGEHGIGIKKKEYLSETEKEAFKNLKLKYNPNNIFGGDNII